MILALVRKSDAKQINIEHGYIYPTPNSLGCHQSHTDLSHNALDRDAFEEYCCPVSRIVPAYEYTVSIK